MKAADVADFRAAPQRRLRRHALNLTESSAMLSALANDIDTEMLCAPRLIAAESLADPVVVTRSEHIPRIQEAQASAFHTLRELVEPE